MVTRTKTESSLGLASANINQWGAGIPFGNQVYRGNTNPYFDIPDSLVDVNGNGIADAGDRTNPSYTPTAATASSAMRRGHGGDALARRSARLHELGGLADLPRGLQPDEDAGPGPNDTTLGEPRAGLAEDLRSAPVARRPTSRQTMSFTVGLEGDFPSGDHSWDVSLYTGRSDNTVNQLGSMRLTSYRDVLSSPNFGRNATFDSNPWEGGGFAESIPTCTSGLPVADDFEVSARLLADDLAVSEERARDGPDDLRGQPRRRPRRDAGPARCSTRSVSPIARTASTYVPDNLSDIQNEVDPIAGLFPNETSVGEFDVAEIYGELLIPIISDGPTGVEHFNVELGGRVSDWSMEQMPNLETYKALIDWGITPRYRIRGGFNRAFRAPNLGELFIKRTQMFGGFGTRDWCSQASRLPATFSATPLRVQAPAPTAADRPIARALRSS